MFDYNFKTVDDLVESVTKHNNNFTEQDACDHVAINCTDILLKALRSETNKTSKHDLMIIKRMSEIRHKSRNQQIAMIFYSIR